MPFSSQENEIIRAKEADEIAADAIRLLAERAPLILNAVDEGIYCLDPAGRTTFVNEAATRMQGFTLREMIGKAQHELIHHHYPDGSVFPADVSALSMPDGNYLGMIRDATERQEALRLSMSSSTIGLMITRNEKNATGQHAGPMTSISAVRPTVSASD